MAYEGKTPTHSIDELIAVVDVITAIVILNVLHELGSRQRELVEDRPQLRGTCRIAREMLVVPGIDS
ncbi:hypothetical protein [Arthrobacter rhizosphaerae]|uniref:hypothetical protein n=1 Tax=Arthrobacter rhizosphaerae TaxID=2855490 RepID=UPI001FF4CC62|nr:hypothetical protein [Arthrobacter rhizosphaerae]